MPTSDPEPIQGVTRPEPVVLSRVPVRMRESGVTLAGWRMSVTCDEGRGSIDLVDGPGGVLFHRGEGIFLGWTPARLAATRARLLPPAPDPEATSGQWG